jgi:hypothetical protein
MRKCARHARGGSSARLAQGSFEAQRKNTRTPTTDFSIAFNIRFHRVTQAQGGVMHLWLLCEIKDGFGRQI